MNAKFETNQAQTVVSNEINNILIQEKKISYRVSLLIWKEKSIHEK